VPGTCVDKTHTSCRVLDALGARARPFRRVFCRFGAASVRSAQRHRYLARSHVRYLGRPGAHKLRRPRSPGGVTYFPAPTSARGTPGPTKLPPAGPNCVPGSLTYPFDTLVAERRRTGGLGQRAGARPVCSISAATLWNCLSNIYLEAIPLGRGARDAYRRVLRDVSDPPLVRGHHLGEESAKIFGEILKVNLKNEL